jgi:hypothetical protein
MISVVIMVTVTCVAIPVFCRDLFVKEALIGWGVSLASGVLGTWLHRRAMRGNSTQFFAWGVGGSALRLLASVGIILGFRFFRAGNLQAFAVTVVVGYLAFAASEVGLLYRQASGSETS